MSMLVCKNACLNLSSCVSFVSSFFSFSFNFFTCTYFSQHVCTMPPHFTHHRIFRYLNFMLLDLHTYAPHYAPLRSRAIRRLFFFQPSDSRCMRHEPQIAKLETTLRTSIGQRFMKVCFLVTVHGRLCASCPFSTKHGRLSVSCPVVLGGVKLEKSVHGLTEALGVAAHLLEYLILYDDGDAGTNQRNSTRRPVVRYCYACSVSRPRVLPSFQWLLLFCWFASWCWLVKIACVGCCKG